MTGNSAILWFEYMFLVAKCNASLGPWRPRAAAGISQKQNLIMSVSLYICIYIPKSRNLQLMDSLSLFFLYIFVASFLCNDEGRGKPGL